MGGFWPAHCLDCHEPGMSHRVQHPVVRYGKGKERTGAPVTRRQPAGWTGSPEQEPGIADVPERAACPGSSSGQGRRPIHRSGFPRVGQKDGFAVDSGYTIRKFRKKE